MKIIKVLLACAALCLSAIAVEAQTSPYALHDKWTTNTLGQAQTYPTRDSVASGTTYVGQITTSGPFNYYGYDTIKLTGTYRTACIVTVLTKVSGTVAGTVRLEGSVDGLTWSTVGADTLTLANQTTNTYTWVLPGRPHLSNSTTMTGTARQADAPPILLPFLYYRVFYAGTGTWCGTYVSKIFPRS